MEDIVKRFPYMTVENFLNESPQWLCAPFLPLKILKCNGDSEYSFNEAKLIVIAYPEQNLDNCGITDFFIYRGLIYELLFNPGTDEPRKQNALQHLGMFFNERKHHICLDKMKTESEKLPETALQAILAVHLFAPLVPNAIVRIDKSKYKGSGNVKCKYCGESVPVGDTSFGNSDVWHGFGDIMLDHSIVTCKIQAVTEEDEVDEASLDYNPEEYNATPVDSDEPATKKMKAENLEGADGDIGSWECTCPFSTTVTEAKTSNGDYLPNGPLKINCTCGESNKTLSQILAQTITNAFLQIRLYPSLRDCFIPTFLASDKYVTVHMYNPIEDILITQAAAMPLWDVDGQLQARTVFSLWLALNMLNFPSHIPTKYAAYAEQLEIYSEKRSNFHTSIASDKLQIYFTDLHMPLQKSKPFHERYFTNSKKSILMLHRVLEKVIAGASK